MPETAVISKEVEVNIEVCVYKITCDCGEDLNIRSVQSDYHGDLVVEVDMHNCPNE